MVMAVPVHSARGPQLGNLEAADKVFKGMQLRPQSRLLLRCVLYEGCSSGQTSTTPCATAQGVRDTISMASVKSAASIMAKPATGNDDVINGPFAVST
jgi:hypothetical protein